MKLSEVTRDILENYLKNDYERLPYPNLRTWMTLAVDLREHAEPKLYPLEKEGEYTLCIEWKDNPNRRKMSVIHHSEDQGTTVFSFQIKRFAYYLYNLECQRHVINEVYHAMLTKPKKFLQSTCNNPDCFNPEHLKESFTPFDVNKAYAHVRGEQHARSKLTEKLVYDIYGDYTKGKESIKDLAKFYKVSVGTVYGILKGRTWKHLNLAPIPTRSYTKLFTYEVKGE